MKKMSLVELFAAALAKREGRDIHQDGGARNQSSLVIELLAALNKYAIRNHALLISALNYS